MSDRLGVLFKIRRYDNDRITVVVGWGVCEWEFAILYFIYKSIFFRINSPVFDSDRMAAVAKTGKVGGVNRGRHLWGNKSIKKE